MTGGPISVFVLARDERLHIERCIRSLAPVAAEVFVVDSGSTDGTQELARALGARVVEHAWENNHARQTNWAIDNLPFAAPWVMRIDSDELLSPELASELPVAVAVAPDYVNGFVLRRRQIFMGRPLRFGGAFPIPLLRVWRRGTARCEERWMDEHIVLTSGTTRTLRGELVDHNLNELRFWTSKEANYAVREAAEIFLARRSNASSTTPADTENRRKRWLKENVYRRLPPFVGPAGYFFYRYVLRLGVLDGMPGLAWHVLQGFWYRFLVDTIVLDIERRSSETGTDPLELLEQLYGLPLRSERAPARGETAS
jgi:glycosyltransferase involved in cell wall biosynthesis